MTDNTTDKPITFRDGAVFATIRVRDSKNGPFPEAKIGRSYKNGRTGEWGVSTTFGRGDVEKLNDLLTNVSREMSQIQNRLNQQRTESVSQTEQEVETENISQPKPDLTAQRDEVMGNTKQHDALPAYNIPPEPSPEH